MSSNSIPTVEGAVPELGRGDKAKTPHPNAASPPPKRRVQSEKYEVQSGHVCGVADTLHFVLRTFHFSLPCNMRAVCTEVTDKETNPLPARPGRGDKIPHTWAAGLLIVALVLGIGWRVVSLGEKSLWWDELMTVQRTDPATLGEVIERLRGSPFPPLHYAIVHVWRQWCGSSNESLRLPSALWGLAGLAALAWIGPELIGQTAARWSLVFAALSACHIWHCRDAKMYAAVWTLSLVSVGLFGTELESERPRWGRLMLWGAASGLLPWFSYVGLAVPAAEFGFGLICLARWWRIGSGLRSAERPDYGSPAAPPAGPRALARLLAVGFIGLLPFVAGWGPQFREALVQRQGLDWLSSPAETMLSRNPLQLLGTLLLGGRTDIEGELPAWGAACQWLHGPLTLLVLAGLAWHARHERRLALVWLAAAVAVPVVGMAVVSLTWLPMWGVARYLVVIHPPLLLLLGRWVTEARPRSVAMAAVAGVLAFNLAWLGVDRICLTRVPWDRLAELSREIALSPDRASPVVERTAGAGGLLGEERPSPMRLGWESSTWLSDAPLAMPHVLRAAFSGTRVAWRAGIVDEMSHPEQLDVFLRAVRLPRDPSQRDGGLPFEAGERVASFVVRGTPDLPLLVAVVEVELWRRRTAVRSTAFDSDGTGRLKNAVPVSGDAQ